MDRSSRMKLVAIERNTKNRNGSFSNSNKSLEGIIGCSEESICAEYNCEDRGYAAARMNLLQHHRGSIHKVGELKFQCENCTYKAISRKDVKRHIKAVHEKIKDHICKECGFAFSRMSSLKMHIHDVHKKIRNHACDKCGAAFARKLALKTHIHSVHDRIKNHVCSYCGFATSQKSFEETQRSCSQE